jgi:hypothetical protein
MIPRVQTNPPSYWPNNNALVQCQSHAMQQPVVRHWHHMMVPWQQKSAWAFEATHQVIPQPWQLLHKMHQIIRQLIIVAINTNITTNTPLAITNNNINITTNKANETIITIKVHTPKQ